MVLNLTLRASSKILHYLTSFYILTSFNCIIKGIEVMQCISINMCIGLVHRIFISVFIFKFCMARWLYKYTRNVCSPLLTCVQCKNWGIKTEKCIFLVQCPNFFGLVFLCDFEIYIVWECCWNLAILTTSIKNLVSVWSFLASFLKYTIVHLLFISVLV